MIRSRFVAGLVPLFLLMTGLPVTAQQQRVASAYVLWFRFVSEMKLENDRAQNRGVASSAREVPATLAGLTSEQGRKVESIALESLKEVRVHDRQARAIIADFKKGKVQMSVARTQLQALQTERDNALLRARQTLRSALGEATFASFEAYLFDKRRRSVAPRPSGNERSATIPVEN